MLSEIIFIVAALWICGWFVYEYFLNGRSLRILLRKPTVNVKEMHQEIYQRSAVGLIIIAIYMSLGWLIEQNVLAATDSLAPIVFWAILVVDPLSSKRMKVIVENRHQKKFREELDPDTAWRGF